jgi:integral membrane sensor domain MASE1
MGFRDWVYFLGVNFFIAAVYFFVADASLFFALSGTNASPVWPASSIGFLAIIWYGFRGFWGVLLGAQVTNIIFFLRGGSELYPSIGASLLNGFGNALEPVVAVFLINHFTQVLSQKNRGSELSWTCWDFLVSIVSLNIGCLVSALNGPFAVCLFGLVPWSAYDSMILSWWLGDLAGILVFSGFFLTLSYLPRYTHSFSSVLESVLYWFSLVCLTSTIFIIEDSYPLAFLPPLVLMWGVHRLTQYEWSFSLIFVSSVAILMTCQGLGPFVADNIFTSLLLLQTYLCSICGVTYFVASVISERKIFLFQVQDINARLSDLVEEQTKELTQALNSIQKSETSLKQQNLYLKTRLEAFVNEEEEESVKNLTSTLREVITFFDQAEQNLLERE